ncbi:carbohydrate ABC transporter permease [Desertihabitans aurantiacus]|uniref:carbohydrate ABC transporter permease n=1 Tax=Desertihabitans aurantiacus TaxID=2282477 RepID=UPI001300723B|nr:sugar ABC transporter permease [Desertihabitans aurantiacus]
MPPPRRGRRPFTAREKRNLRLGLLFISPWALGFLVLVAYPLVYSLVISLFNHTGFRTPTFIGLGNYSRLVQDPLVAVSASNTLFYAALAVPIGLVVAIVLALAMNRKVPEVGLYRTALYLPSLVPIFALSFIFVVFVNPNSGLLNQFLGLFGMPETNLLGDATSAKVIIVTMAQLGAGNAALIFLAGLNNIPESLYESARVDGAGTLRRFFSITLPLLSPTILFNLITGVSGALQVFTQAYIVTEGGPNNGTLFYMYHLYKSAFSYAQLGYASALAVVLFLAGMVLAVLIYVLSRRFVNYDVTG